MIILSPIPTEESLRSPPSLEEGPPPASDLLAPRPPPGALRGGPGFVSTSPLCSSSRDRKSPVGVGVGVGVGGIFGCFFSYSRSRPLAVEEMRLKLQVS